MIFLLQTATATFLFPRTARDDKFSVEIKLCLQ